MWRSLGVCRIIEGLECHSVAVTFQLLRTLQKILVDECEPGLHAAAHAVHPLHLDSGTLGQAEVEAGPEL